MELARIEECAFHSHPRGQLSSRRIPRSLLGAECIVLLQVVCPDPDTSTNAGFGEAVRVSSAEAMDCIERQEESDYLDGECYYEIVG
jgi:hypothetical protein